MTASMKHLFKIIGNVLEKPQIYEITGVSPKIWVVATKADVVTDDLGGTWTKCTDGAFYCQAEEIGTVTLDYL